MIDTCSYHSTLLIREGWTHSDFLYLEAAESARGPALEVNVILERDFHQQPATTHKYNIVTTATMLFGILPLKEEQKKVCCRRRSSSSNVSRFCGGRCRNPRHHHRLGVWRCRDCGGYDFGFHQRPCRPPGPRQRLLLRSSSSSSSGCANKNKQKPNHAPQQQQGSTSSGSSSSLSSSLSSSSSASLISWKFAPKT